MCKSILGRNSKLKPNSPLFHIKTKQNAKNNSLFCQLHLPGLEFFQCILKKLHFKSCSPHPSTTFS